MLSPGRSAHSQNATKSPDDVTSKCCQSWHSFQVILCYVNIRTEYQIKCVLMKGNGTNFSVENHSHFVFIIGVMGRRSFANPLGLCWKWDSWAFHLSNQWLHLEFHCAYCGYQKYLSSSHLLSHFVLILHYFICSRKRHVVRKVQW